MSELAEKLEAVLQPSLGAGDQLLGACVATQQSTFKGRMVAIGVTDTRLIIQGVNRKWLPDGAPTELTAERIADLSAAGAGGGWATINAAIMDAASVTLKLKTVEGEKLKLTMMRGGGGPLGGLGGGEAQREGVEALGAWFERNSPELS